MSRVDDEDFASVISECEREDVPCHEGKASPDMRSAASTSSDGECTDELIGLVTASEKNYISGQRRLGGRYTVGG